MSKIIWLIPLIPFISSINLMLFGKNLRPSHIGYLGVSSVGISALLTLLLAIEFMQNQEVLEISVWTWMQVGNFAPGISFYFDGLTLVMMSVITGVGFLILGMMLHAGLTLVTVKLVFVGIFVFFTSPIAGHAVMQAALFFLAGVAVCHYGVRTIDDIGRIGKQSLWITGSFVVLALGMIGLPPTGGFLENGISCLGR